MSEEYKAFLEKKKRNVIQTGIDISEEHLNPLLFDFQKYAVKQALSYGRYALFEECGLGKTFQQIEFAKQLTKTFNENALIIAPLGVSGQTIKQAEKFGYEIVRANSGKQSQDKIEITNYEQLDNIDFDRYEIIVLDESSILKNFEGQTKKKLIEVTKNKRFRLPCTATPSPNDDMEICNHAEFLGIDRREQILAMYFTHDGGDTAKWRLKGHAKQMFWNFVKSWSLFISNPSDIGFDGSKFILPELNIVEHLIETPSNGQTLFNDISVNATDFNRELRNTLKFRTEKTIELAESTNDQIIIWCKQNEESKFLSQNIKGAVEITGSDAPEEKEEKLMAFASGQINKIVTKTKIAGYGMNFQNCHHQIHASFDFSFESLYQSIRRSYRFGQLHPVKVHLIVTDTMQNVLKSIMDKDAQFEQMKNFLNK